MRAATYSQYGDPSVVTIKTLPDPLPGPSEILIRTRVSTVNSADRRLRAMDAPSGFGILMRLIYGIWRPRQTILGTSLAGVVDAVGENVTAFAPGDRVTAATGAALGAHAELVVVPDTNPMAKIPEGVSDEAAAACTFGGHTALYFLRDLAQLQPGEHIAINGASGSVGTACIQIAKLMSAEVTAICSAANVKTVRRCGADHVINYETTDFTASGIGYDVIADCVGNAPWSRVRPSLDKTGRHLMIIATLAEMIQAGFVSRRHGKRSLGGAASESSEDLAQLMTWLASGELAPVIDSRFTLDQIQAAHARVDTDRKVGSVILIVDPAKDHVSATSAVSAVL